ncbi:hypothetical protein [Streptomyces sp. NPDC006668]|uniref:hypothetical protein n=1 Tax=Streptomyces sp. NPDC006668 TaxID=3156903 RepID=UPI0033E064E8
MSSGRRLGWNKVPEVTLYFWVIKVLCTTAGETAADRLNEKRERRSRSVVQPRRSIIVVDHHRGEDA